MIMHLTRRSFVAGAALSALGVAFAGSAIASGVARADEGQTVTIEALGADGSPIEQEVPFDPQRIAILDLACLDILGTLGLADRVVGSASTTVQYLLDYLPEGVAPLGNIKEADFEAVMACEPDIIFIGGRLSRVYAELAEIAPVVYLATDTELGVVESVRKNAGTIAKIFGLEAQIDEMMAKFDDQIATIAQIGSASTALVGMCTSGSFNALGNTGRCSLIVNECGFENIAIGTSLIQERGEGGSEGRGGQTADGEAQAGDSGSNPHGQESSFETIVSLDPDYIFVMDRDAAIGTEGAQQAREILDNELINSTRAYADGHIVYLEHPAVWYTVEGGITALQVMIEDLNAGLGIADAE